MVCKNFAVTTPDPGPLRERRRRATEDALHCAAVELILEHGYDAVTVPMISDRAGVSTRTFFNYFPNKETAVVRPFPPLGAELSEVVRTGPGADGLIADLADLVVEHVLRHTGQAFDVAVLMPLVCEIPALLRLHTGELAQLEEQLAELIGARVGLPGADRRVAVVAAAVMSAVHTAVLRWSARPEAGELADEIRCCLTLLEPLQRSLAGHDTKGV